MTPKMAVARSETVVTHPAAPLAEQDRARCIRLLSPAVTAARDAGQDADERSSAHLGEATG